MAILGGSICSCYRHALKLPKFEKHKAHPGIYHPWSISKLSSKGLCYACTLIEPHKVLYRNQ